MGGKQWTLEEETVFWTQIVPRAPPGLDAQSNQHKKKGELARSWAPLAKMMTRLMKQRLGPGEELRRKYTPCGCYEHYFQNYVHKVHSPHAGALVKEYEAKLNSGALNHDVPEPSTSPVVESESYRHAAKRALRRKNGRFPNAHMATSAHTTPERSMGLASQMAPVAQQALQAQKTMSMSTEDITPLGNRWGQTASPTSTGHSFQRASHESPAPVQQHLMEQVREQRGQYQQYPFQHMPATMGFPPQPAGSGDMRFYNNQVQLPPQETGRSGYDDRSGPINGSRFYGNVNGPYPNGGRFYGYCNGFNGNANGFNGNASGFNGNANGFNGNANGFNGNGSYAIPQGPYAQQFQAMVERRAAEMLAMQQHGSAPPHVPGSSGNGSNSQDSGLQGQNGGGSFSGDEQQTGTDSNVAQNES